MGHVKRDCPDKPGSEIDPGRGKKQAQNTIKAGETLKTFENSLSLVGNQKQTHQELFIEFLSFIMRMMMIYNGLDK
jgi:hypothetical protein